MGKAGSKQNTRIAQEVGQPTEAASEGAERCSASLLSLASFLLHSHAKSVPGDSAKSVAPNDGPEEKLESSSLRVALPPAVDGKCGAARLVTNEKLAESKLMQIGGPGQRRKKRKKQEHREGGRERAKDDVMRLAEALHTAFARAGLLPASADEEVALTVRLTRQAAAAAVTQSAASGGPPSDGRRWHHDPALVAIVRAHWQHSAAAAATAAAATAAASKQGEPTAPAAARESRGRLRTGAAMRTPADVRTRCATCSARQATAGDSTKCSKMPKACSARVATDKQRPQHHHHHHHHSRAAAAAVSSGLHEATARLTTTSVKNPAHSGQCRRRRKAAADSAHQQPIDVLIASMKALEATTGRKQQKQQQQPSEVRKEQAAQAEQKKMLSRCGHGAAAGRSAAAQVSRDSTGRSHCAAGAASDSIHVTAIHRCYRHLQKQRRRGAGAAAQWVEAQDFAAAAAFDTAVGWCDDDDDEDIGRLLQQWPSKRRQVAATATVGGCEPVVQLLPPRPPKSQQAAAAAVACEPAKPPPRPPKRPQQ